MTLRKRNKRKIVLNGDVFYWTYKLRQDILRLTIMTEDKTNSRLVCDFRYKDSWLYFSEYLKTEERYDDPLLIMTKGVLTPWLVSQVIDYALQKGWKPFNKGKDFLIKDTEDKVDINFWTETKTEEHNSAIQNPKSKI